MDIAEDGIATIMIDRPARRDALNLVVKRQIAESVERCIADAGTRVILLTSASGYFVAGTEDQGHVAEPHNES